MLQLDAIDLKILNILQIDSRLSHKDIGTQVHRTGQAVGQRIQRLIDLNVIEKYTIKINYSATQFIRIIMENNQFSAFEAFLKTYVQVEKSYKVSGSACYMLISHFEISELNLFIEALSEWGHYSVDHVVRCINN
ncbi:transcriptional regulator [Acinetobacter defluvii]|uniref:AsnC family transcriptional regulator n=1 Tax=Acinetobacter defluvii TaxID=1871111 RepID=A0A2S2FC38_9GAMM|nr:AsnC family transcriptional regulator [Acinetobacter defluvii]AWL28450.1 AsnC family transcriptional regulator [Acinetobacter defluvii]NNP73285.1 transcriptional regulator [Acinetobacter defluvii]